MSVTRWVGVTVMAALLTTACQKKHVEDTASLRPQPMPASAELRARLQRLEPKALIGKVIRVLPENRLAAVAEIPTATIRKGDVIAFWGGEDAFLTTGEVVRIVDNTLHVQYHPPQNGKREPAEGDLAIYDAGARQP